MTPHDETKPTSTLTSEVKRMKKAEVEKEWLTSNAITAFAGALFVAYGWHISDDTIKLPFNLTLPGLPDCVYFALGSLLFVLAFVLLSGSIVPALRPWAFRTGSSFSPIFGLLAWVAFTLGWVSVIPVLQEINQLWSKFYTGAASRSCCSLHSGSSS